MEVPCLRHTSDVGDPPSASCATPMICASAPCLLSYRCAPEDSENPWTSLRRPGLTNSPMVPSSPTWMLRTWFRVMLPR